MALRAMLRCGRRAVIVTPDVCTWKRNFCAAAEVTPSSSRTKVAHIRRAARNLAISSKKSLWASRKNEMRGSAASGARPRPISSLAAARPWASVSASSNGASAPASR